MQTLVKLKINHNAQTGREVPWDLLYLIKKDETAIATRLFNYHLIVEDDAVIKDFLTKVEFSAMENYGMSRSDTAVVNVGGRKPLSDFVDLASYSLLIPILPRGKSAGSKKLRYLTSKSWKYHVKTKSAEGTYREAKSSQGLSLPKVLLSAGKHMEGNPCLGCTNMAKKIVDDKACILGSAECLTKLVVGKGSSFNEAVKGGVK